MWPGAVFAEVRVMVRGVAAGGEEPYCWSLDELAHSSGDSDSCVAAASPRQRWPRLSQHGASEADRRRRVGRFIAASHRHRA